MEEMMGGFFTLIYGGDDIVGPPHANTPHKGLDLMVPQKTHAFGKYI